MIGLAAVLRSLSLAGIASACVVYTGAPPPPPPPGSAIMDWTVSGTKDPRACAESRAATFRVVLYGSSGAFAGEWAQDCGAFSTTIGGLAPDTYTGSADLLDASDRPRTTSVSLAPFGVAPATATTVYLDFPPSSFYP